MPSLPLVINAMRSPSNFYPICLSEGSLSRTLWSLIGSCRLLQNYFIPFENFNQTSNYYVRITSLCQRRSFAALTLTEWLVGLQHQDEMEAGSLPAYLSSLDCGPYSCPQIMYGICYLQINTLIFIAESMI